MVHSRDDKVQINTTQKPASIFPDDDGAVLDRYNKAQTSFQKCFQKVATEFKKNLFNKIF